VMMLAKSVNYYEIQHEKNKIKQIPGILFRIVYLYIPSKIFLCKDLKFKEIAES